MDVTSAAASCEGKCVIGRNANIEKGAESDSDGLGCHDVDARIGEEEYCENNVKVSQSYKDFYRSQFSCRGMMMWSLCILRGNVLRRDRGTYYENVLPSAMMSTIFP